MRRFIATAASASTRRRAFTSPAKSKIPDSIANGTSGAYIEDMYAAWKRDPTSVHASWQAYFKALADPSSMNDLLSGLQSITQSPFISGNSKKKEKKK
jgi:2-oxoglutarate dehydrogenase complex dehydrogenase (E1) component-like enzyme